MRTSDLVRYLRRLGVLRIAGMARRFVARPICELIHLAVTFVDPTRLPVNLVLKHEYDYRLVHVDPHNVPLWLSISGWRRENDASTTWWERVRRWHRLGGGWKSVRNHLSRNLHGAFIADGDWDQRAKPVGVVPVVHQLFVEGRSPHETDQYKRYARDIKLGRVAWSRAGSLDELDAHYLKLIDAFEDIRDNGYRAQDELGNCGADEIRVCVDRRGQFCLYGGGTHRLAIAKLLNVPQVPVIVKRVHKNWVADCMEQAGVPDVLEAVRYGIAELAASSKTSGTGSTGDEGHVL